MPSPNFDYKLRWFERFIRYAKRLYELPGPVVIAGDLNVVPTDFDIYNPGWWRFDAVMQPQTREAYGEVAGARLDRCGALAATRESACIHTG